MEFDQNGALIRTWDGFDSDAAPGIISGIAIDNEGHVWVTDSTNNRLMRYTLP
jgi:sugar lactone lactonase YvrE